MYIKTDLNDDQKITLNKLFRRKFIEPQVVAQQLRLKRVDAIALLDRLVQDHPQHFLRRNLVYHTCSEAPVALIPDTKTIKQGWVCPQCEEEVRPLLSLTLDFAYSAIAPVEFLVPDDGLVRYWEVDYFPYFIKTCKTASEPAMVLRSGDAEMFDLVLEGQASSRQKSFLRMEEQYKESVYAIAKDIATV